MILFFVVSIFTSILLVPPPSLACDCLCSVEKIYKGTNGSNGLKDLPRNKWQKKKSFYIKELRRLGIKVKGSYGTGIQKGYRNRYSYSNVLKNVKKQMNDWKSGEEQPRSCRASTSKPNPVEIEPQEKFVNGECENTCREMGSLVVSQTGQEKLSKMLFDRNEEMFEQNIVETGFLDPIEIFETAEGCRYKNVSAGLKKGARYVKDIGSTNAKGESCFGFPKINKDGSFDLSQKPKPVKMLFNRGKIEGMDIEMLGTPSCKNNLCRVKIKVNSMRIKGNFNVADKKAEKEKLFQANSLIFSAKGTDDNPIVYEFDAALNTKTGGLENLVQVKSEAAKINISRENMSLDFEETEETYTKLTASAFDGLCDVFDEGNFNETKWKKELKKYADALEYVGYPPGEVQRMYKQRTRKEFVYGVRDICSLSVLPEEAFADQTIEQRKRFLFKQIGEQGKYKRKFFQIPMIDKGIDKGLTEEMMRQRGARSVKELGAQLTILDMVKSYFFDGNKGSEIVAERLQESISEVGDNINRSMNMLPDYVNEGVTVETPPLQLLWKSDYLRDKIRREIRDYKTAVKNGDDEAAKRRKDRLEELYVRQKANLQEQKRFAEKLDLQVMTSQSKIWNDAVNFHIHKGKKGCLKELIPPSDEGSDPFDLRSEISLEAINDMLEKMYKDEKLEICDSPNREYKNCDNWGVKLSKPPKVEINKSRDGYKVIIDKADVGGPIPLLGRLDGKVSVDFDLKPTRCREGRGLCLKMKDSNGKWHGFLNLLGAGFAVEKAVDAAIRPWGKTGLHVPSELKLLREPQINSKGAIVMDWNIEPLQENPALSVP